MKRITICIATRNRKDVLHQLLWSLRNQTYQWFDVIIVDDGEDKFDLDSWEKDEMYGRIIKELRKAHKVQIIPSLRTGKLGAVLQEGYKWADKHWNNPYFCRCDDDIWLNTDYFEKLVKVFSKDQNIAVCAGLVLDPGADIQVMSAQDDRRSKWGKVATISNDPNLQWIRHENTDLIDVEFLQCPQLMRMDRLKAIGGFDTHLFDHFREESYHSWRFFVEGWRVVIDPSVECWHLRAPNGGVRQRGNPLDDARKFNIIRKDMKPGIHLNLTHAIGDLIAATPMLEELRKKYPDKNISVFHPLAKDVLVNNPNVDHICEGVLDEQRTRRIEFSIYSWMSQYDWTSHISNAYCKAVDLPEIDNPVPKLYGIEPKEGNYVVIAPQSHAKIFDFSDFSRTKHWPNDRWNEIIIWLKEEFGVDVVHLSGKEMIEVLDGVQIVNGVGYREAFSWVAGARCLISIDTMADHVAAALDTPAVVMWGRSESSVYGYEKENIINIQGQCPQNHPCHGGVAYQQDKSHCPIAGHPCMSFATVDMVKEAVRSVIRDGIHTTSDQ